MTEPIHHYRFDPARLETLHTDHDEYYALLVDREYQVVVLEVVITWILWYSVYFWLTEEEYRLFGADKAAFDKLARAYAQDKGERRFAERLLRHEGPGGDRFAATAPVALSTL